MGISTKSVHTELKFKGCYLNELVLTMVTRKALEANWPSLELFGALDSSDPISKKQQKIVLNGLTDSELLFACKVVNALLQKSDIFTPKVRKELREKLWPQRKLLNRVGKKDVQVKERRQLARKCCGGMSQAIKNMLPLLQAYLQK